MPQFSDAFAALAPALDFDPVTVVTIAWPDGSKRYSERAIGFTDLGACDPRILALDVGASQIGLRPGGMGFVGATARFANRDRAITRLLLDGDDPTGVLCSARWAAVAPGRVALPVADWFTGFSGLLDTFEDEEGGDVVAVTLKPNDGPLKGLLLKAQILASEAPLAPSTSRGIYFPIVYGSHDAQALTGRGMVPAICWAYDVGTTQFRFSPMLGIAKAIPRVYLNGTVQVLTTDYVLSYPVVGGKRITSIDFVADPGPDAVVTCDIDGVEDVGDGTGELITNRVDQLQHILANRGFGDVRDPGVSGWADPTSAPLDLASFARAASHAAQISGEGAIHVGGDAQAMRIEDFLGEWGRSNPLYRLYATPTGAVGLAILPDLRFAGYQSPGPAYATTTGALFVRSHVHVLQGSFRYSPDSTTLVRRVDIEHLFGAQDNKYFGNLALEDVSQTIDVAEAFQMRHSLARLE